MPARQRRTLARPARTRLAVDVSCDQVRVGVARRELAGVAAHVLRSEGVRDALLSVTLVSPRAIARLNRRHLGHRGATDVITFGLTPAGAAPAAIVGDIYICPGVARTHASAYRVPVRDELLRLVVHGTLHVLGWDHPKGEDRVASPMWARQELLLRRWRRRGARR